MDEKYCIGYGTYPLKEELTSLIPELEDNGYFFIDTSDDYMNEDYVAKGTEGRNIKIFSKFSFVDNVLKFDEYFNNQEQTYKQRGRKINCYMLHWPFPYLYKKIWKKMEKLYLDGRVDEIGVCNFTVKDLEELIKECNIKPMYNQIEIHPLFQQKDIVEFCQKNKIQIISYSPFARMDSDLIKNENIILLAKKYETTVHNIILKWNIQKGFIPIPSTSNINHLKEMSIKNLKNIMLTDNEISIIDSLESGKRVRFNPDTYFSKKSKLKFFLYSLLMR